MPIALAVYGVGTRNQKDALTTVVGVNPLLPVAIVVGPFMGKIVTWIIWLKRNKNKNNWKKI